MRRFAALALLVAGLAATGGGDRPATPAAPPVTDTPQSATAPQLYSAVVTVCDVEGRPVAKRPVRVIDPGTSAQVFAGVTDREGTVTLTSLDPSRSYELRVESPKDTSSSTSGIRLLDWTPRAETIHVPTYGEVSGTVVDAFGRPVADVRVDWPLALRGGEPPVRWSQPPEGTFSVAGYRTGPTVELSVRGQFAIAGSPPIATKTLRVFDHKAVLVVSVGATLTVVLPRGCEHTLVDLVAHRAAVANGVVSPGVPPRVRFVGLSATDRFTVWVPPGPGGWYGLMEDVPADGLEHAVTLVPGEPIDVQVVLPKGVGRRFVEVRAERDGLVSTASEKPGLRAEGRIRLVGLPKGLWRVKASTPALDPPWTAEADAPAGGAVTLTLARE